MRICILCSFEEAMQKDTGASVRVFNLAKGLSEIKNNVRVILPRGKAKFERMGRVNVYGLRGLLPVRVLSILKNFVNVLRPTALYFYDPLFAARVGCLLRDADVVQIEHPSSAGFLIAFVKIVLRKPIVVDCHDAFQSLRVQHTSIFRRFLETSIEKLAYKIADNVLVVSESEKRLLLSYGVEEKRVLVVPNGVDTEAFRRSVDSTRIKKEYNLEGFRTVVFVGNLSYAPNREAIELLDSRIAPVVNERLSNVKFLVVGKLRHNFDLQRLSFTGFVDDVASVISACDVAVAPLFQGSGTRLKILEYFSCGLPVVSTSIGVEGLDVKDGANIFIENEPDKFAFRIVELLGNRGLAESMGNAARVLAVTNYDWKHIVRKLEESLSGIALD